jgi:colanic acid biosynthesis glycosyl transferase WcaI
MPKALIFYHFFYPDDVISATIISELAEGLVKRGWDVTAMPSNRAWHDESNSYSSSEEWKGVHIRRVWRPGLSQASTLGRIVNAAWMIFRWSLAALSFKQKPDVIIIGTDPILSLLAVRFWKLFRPRTIIMHWCFDLYPEAAIADGLFKSQGLAHRVIRWLLRPAYRDCDLLGDIGSCMRELLSAYKSPAKLVTLTPWALEEPNAPLRPDLDERKLLFGDAALALMYSGSFGRAHSYREILDLARLWQGYDIRLVFGIRGSREQMLREAVKADNVNITFCGFASAERLEARLSAPDIHVVSLRTEWTGMVVPSKFFGAIAAGRPVLFSGSRDSALAKWIESYGLGWVLTPDNVSKVADQIISYASSPEQQLEMRRHCYEIYHKYFSKDRVLDSFDHELRKVLYKTVAPKPNLTRL